MANILCLETSASLCSVGLYTPEKTYYLENQKTLAHAEFLAPLVQQILNLANLQPTDLNAVAISGGPGSYTGLRIGCSTAKGLCYALNIPLIAIDTLQIIAHAAIQQNSNYDYYWPMIDARRMEVYHTIFDKNLIPLRTTSNLIIDDSFLLEDVILNDNENLKSKILKSKIAMCGDGAAKSSETLNLPVIDAVANAQAMFSIALKKIEAQQFENTAYYEPFYLKQANITVSKK